MVFIVGDTWHTYKQRQVYEKSGEEVFEQPAATPRQSGLEVELKYNGTNINSAISGS